jgi:hypothetical protein
MSNTNCPIAIFAFKRPDHLQRALESLDRCPEFSQSPLRIYCDGPRNEGEAQLTEQARRVAERWPHPSKTVVARPLNLGLAKSISTGVAELCTEFGRAIVIEDDLTVSPVYLRYMNDALDRYEGAERVMQVAGHVYPARFRSTHDAVMLPMSSTLGWGTWRRAWDRFDPGMARRGVLDADPQLRRRFDLGGAYPYYKMLQAQLAGNVDSWGIKWYLSVFLADGLCVFPTQSLVAHEFDGTGTHCSTPQYRDQPLRMTPITRWPAPEPDPESLEDFKDFIRRDRRPWVKALRYLRSKFGVR